MSILVLRTAQDILDAVGSDLGYSEWLLVDQARVDRFADAVDDHQWIHCDAERSKQESSFGGTIAHGMLVLSLLGKLRRQLIEARIEIAAKMGVFYGFDRVRFAAPVPVGSRIRAKLKVDEAKMVSLDVLHVVYGHIVEIEGGEKPALIASAINRIYLA